MRPSHILASGMFLGLAGGMIILMSAPAFNLPCEISVQYTGKQFISSARHPYQGEVRTVVRVMDLKGTGKIAGNRLVCNVDLQKQGAM